MRQFASETFLAFAPQEVIAETPPTGPLTRGGGLRRTASRTSLTPISLARQSGRATTCSVAPTTAATAAHFTRSVAPKTHRMTTRRSSNSERGGPNSWVDKGHRMYPAKEMVGPRVTILRVHQGHLAHFVKTGRMLILVSSSRISVSTEGRPRLKASGTPTPRPISESINSRGPHADTPPMASGAKEARADEGGRSV